MAGALGAAAASIWLREAHDVTSVLVTASLLGASIGVLLSSNWALANELGTKGREALHMGVVNLATTGGSAASQDVGAGDRPAKPDFGRLWIRCVVDHLLHTLRVRSGRTYAIEGSILRRTLPAGSPEEAG